MLDRIVQETKAYYCLECGICTGSCPISRFDSGYSPRLMVENALLEPPEKTIWDKGVWSCLTCRACSSRCPSLVDYNEFTRGARMVAREAGQTGICTHTGTLQALMELQTVESFRKDTRWIGDGLRVSDRGEYLYFVGCLPYFNIVFEDIGIDGLQTARSAIKVLNAMGIIPAVSPNERCCGHDLYWSGDLAHFRELARRNLKMIKETGAKTVVFSCPEGYATFKLVYPKFFGRLKFEVLHLSEMVSRGMEKGAVVLQEVPGKVTYQDPCRLGRFLGIYEAPRQILRGIPGVEFAEMGRIRADALCCGSSGWINCTRVNKKIQLERLREARDTGAEVLVTACPKCSIHLKCALHDGDFGIKIQVKDINVLLAESLGDSTNA